MLDDTCLQIHQNELPRNNVSEVSKDTASSDAKESSRLLSNAEGVGSKRTDPSGDEFSPWTWKHVDEVLNRYVMPIVHFVMSGILLYFAAIIIRTLASQR